MLLAEFLRLYPLRAQSIMWFFGAGASAASRVPTAFHMIQQFKRAIFCAAQRVPLSACDDLSDPALISRLQHYFDSLGGFPEQDSADEYAAYFEAAYPAEADRARYFRQLMSGAEPSYGYNVLAVLMKLAKARLIWTTNFDPLIEDAAGRLPQMTGAITQVNLDNADMAISALNEGRWPVLVKLHGDFRSQRLKNTAAELQTQDAKLHQTLLEAGRRFGLAVVGYSGRDSSVMDSLNRILDAGKGIGFPFGLFWFHYEPSPVLAPVRALIERAKQVGIEAHLINIQTFDEFMADLLGQLQDVPMSVRDLLNVQRSRVSPVPFPERKGTWPVMKFNALQVASYPTICRRIACKIGGTEEVRGVLVQAGARATAIRKSVGVIGFGDDSDLKNALKPFQISAVDVHAIQPQSLTNEYGELGLLYDSLLLALSRERPLISKRRGSKHQLIIDRSRVQENWAARFSGAVQGPYSGKIPGTGVDWSEALTIKLEFRFEALWILLSPTIWFELSDDAHILDKSKEFVRARSAPRYNRIWNQLLDLWAELVTGDAQASQIRAFGTANGLDAVFEIKRTNAFSYRCLQK